MNKNLIQNKIYCLLTIVNPNWNIKLRYRAIYKRKLSMRNPRTFVEKLLWLRIKYYNKSPLVIQCADKVAVRDYVKSAGYGRMLNDIYGVYKSVNDVPWNDLPDQFAMKWNFGATYNIICNNKGELDIDSAKGKMKVWGENNYYLPYAEMQYKYCEKRILVEKYLETSQGFLPYDYKLYCFDGKCKAILFITDRDKDKKGGFYTPDWKFIGLPSSRYQLFEEEPNPPASLVDMIECAESLSEGIPFVRIDFYDYDGKAIFGEMTFTPAAGLTPSQIEIDGQDMGDFIDLKKKGKII